MNPKPFDLELGIPCEPEFRPNMISKAHMPLIFKDVPESVKVYAREILARGWKIYAVKQSRGRCYHSGKVITIPTWVIDGGNLGEKIWYISHEISHAHTPGDKHGPRFMAKLQEICPAAYVHHELGYKSRNAASAGIRKPGDVDSFDLL